MPPAALLLPCLFVLVIQHAASAWLAAALSCHPALQYSVQSCVHAGIGLLQDDVKEGPLELYHRLKLYDDAGVSNPKKPVRVRVVQTK
jgi:hypothetical protein